MTLQIKKDWSNFQAVVPHRDAYVWKIILIFIVQPETRYAKIVIIHAGTVQVHLDPSLDPRLVLIAIIILQITDFLIIINVYAIQVHLMTVKMFIALFAM